MVTVIMICLWGAALAGWSSAWYFYKAGVNGNAPSMDFMFKLALASVISVAIGCFMASILGTIKGGIM